MFRNLRISFFELSFIDGFAIDMLAIDKPFWSGSLFYFGFSEGQIGFELLFMRQLYIKLFKSGG